MEADPHAVGIAWAGVTIDCRDPERTASFWSALLEAEARPVGPDRDGWYRLGPVVPGGPVLTFQPVPEQKVGKVRIHLDLWVDDLDAAVRRAERSGGRRVGEREVVPSRGTIAVMADPEGHELCLISADRPSVLFRIMSPPELTEFIADARDLYVAERTAAGDDTRAAVANAERTFGESFPGGAPAFGHAVFVLEDGGARAGTLWTGPSDEGPGRWWVYSVVIQDERRGRGLGRAAMRHAEDVARAAGAGSIGLNVFAPNEAAKRLYESLGYEVTASSPLAVNMSKPL
jgi:ribosomal protein S18 acetylase RimI-like enzyme